MELQSSGPALLVILFSLVCLTSANVADVATKLTAHYEVINHNPGGTYYASIILSNRGKVPITSAGGWSLYFCHENLIEFQRFNVSSGQYINPTSRGGFTLSHVDGCMYKFTPDPARFQEIKPNTMRRITFVAAMSISGIFDVYPYFYIADDTQSFAVIQNTKSYRWYVSPFTNTFQYTRDPPRDPILPVSPTRNFILLANQTYPPYKQGDILPTPRSVTIYKNKVMIDSNWRFYSPATHPEKDNMMSYFETKLKIQRTNVPRTANVIVFKLQPASSSIENAAESYTITISATYKYVEIVGSTTHGWLNGFQTLLNLVEEKAQPGGTTAYEVSELKIIDGPRFKHRALLLDVASNFVSLATVKKLMHMMALVKLNKLQLLLANDYGVRLEIKSLPGFHTVGSKRCHDSNEQTCLFSQLGSDPSGQGIGSGFYTINEYKDLLSLAKQLHIEIIPMWSFDSNMRASEIAIRAYSKAQRDNTMDWSLPQLDATSPLKGNLFRIGTVDYCAEETEVFIRTIISNIKSYHTDVNYPLRTFGIGGDDTNPEIWYQKCQERNKLTTNPNPYVNSKLQFNIMLSKIFTDYDITLNSYDNQFTAFPTRCTSADCTDWFTPYDVKKWFPNPNFRLSVTHRDPGVYFRTRLPTRAPNDTISQHDVETKLRMFQRVGYPSIISLQDVLDFSMKEEPGPYVQGEMPMTRAPIPIQHVYSMWPEAMCCSRYDCSFNDSRHPLKMHPYIRRHNMPICIEDPNGQGPIGMQASISTRKVLSEAALFQLLFPRLIAFAERAWHRASWENTVQSPITNASKARADEFNDFLRFKTILGTKILPALDKNKVQYYMSPPGAILRNVTPDATDMNRVVFSKTEYPGFVAQIKTDGMTDFEDVVENKVYGGATVQFRTRNKDSTRFSRSEVVSKNNTDKYVREHVQIINHLAEKVALEFPIQTRFRNQDDPSGNYSFSLQSSLPLYFDKDFGRFFNRAGYQAFLPHKTRLLQERRAQMEQHMQMMRQMAGQNAGTAPNPNNRGQTVPAAVGSRPQQQQQLG